MYNINKYIRATQYLNNQGKNWRLYNSQDGNLYYIDSALYDIIRYINRYKIDSAFDLSTFLCRYLGNKDEVISLQQFLLSNNIIVDDYRILAYQYTGTYANPNPVTCFVEEKHEKNTAIF